MKYYEVLQHVYAKHHYLSRPMHALLQVSVGELSIHQMFACKHDLITSIYMLTKIGSYNASLMPNTLSFPGIIFTLSY